MEELSPLTEDFLAKNKNKKIVFTNGCFDLLHLGHVEYLNEARALGDCLIVAINSDESVRKIKGSNRPINNEEDRKKMLLNLRAVDCVQIFKDETPLQIIKQIRPKVLVKGGDWKKEEIIGSDFVTSIGGITKSLMFKEGYSTTNLIKALQGKI